MPVIHAQSSSGISPTGPPTATPALLTSRSTSPSQPVASACSRRMSSSFETSQRTAFAVPPRCSTWRAVSARPTSSTSARTRRAPRDASSYAIARPSPEAAPVRTHEGWAGIMGADHSPSARRGMFATCPSGGWTRGTTRRRDVLAQRRHEVGPPHADHAAERGADEAVARGVVVAQRAPAAVAHGDERALARGLEADLDERLLVGRVVHAAPLELEAPRRLPARHLADLDGARPRRGVERLEEASAERALEEELPAAAPRDAELHALAPPLVDLAREHVERVALRDADEDRDARRVARRRRGGHVDLLGAPRVRSACRAKASSSPAQKCSTSSSHRRSARKGSRRRR